MHELSTELSHVEGTPQTPIDDVSVASILL
jgi:hypothetical protein